MYKDKLKEFLRNLFNRFEYFCNTTHLHGLKFVGNRDNPILVRVLWAIAFSWYLSVMSINFVKLVEDYQAKTINFLTETTYLDWNTTFPSVTVCQIDGINSSLLEAPYDERDSSATFENFINELVFFQGGCYSCVSTLCYSCSEVNISETVSKLRMPCEEVLGTCKWNNIDFSCCDEFMPLETEFGICYSINSWHTTNRNNNSKLNWKVNRKSEARKLFIETLENARVYFHAPEDVPFINSYANQRHDVAVGDVDEVVFKVMEIVNDETILSVPIEKRECRFPEEVPYYLKVYNFYSYSTCLVQCHAEHHLEFCNCTHHSMPYYNKQGFCDYDGLKCLTDNFERFHLLKARSSEKLGYTCECLPSCIEPEYNIISHRKITNQSTSGISFNMQFLPTSRLRRVVVKSLLDLAVSIGGTAGLYIGASISTVVEIIYIFFIRM